MPSDDIRVVSAELMFATPNLTASSIAEFFDRIKGPVGRTRTPQEAERKRENSARTLLETDQAIVLVLHPAPGSGRSMELSVRSARAGKAPKDFRPEATDGDALHMWFDTIGLWPHDPVQELPFAVGVFRQACEVFRARFAVVDEKKAILRPAHIARDLRGFGWGAAVYGPEAVQLLGRDRVFSAPAYKIEELPYGGIWVQAAENPFRAQASTKRAIERHLELGKRFPGPGGLQVRRSALKDHDEGDEG